MKFSSHLISFHLPIVHQYYITICTTTEREGEREVGGREGGGEGGGEGERNYFMNREIVIITIIIVR